MSSPNGSSRKKILALLNQQSGGAAASKNRIEQLAQRDATALLRIDQNADELLVKRIEEYAPDRIVMIGGDGTASRLLQIVPQTSETEFGVVPTGTGNDLARSLDLPLGDIEAAWQLATTGRASSIDLIETSLGHPRYLVNAMTAGIGGVVAREVAAESKQNYGPLAYWMQALSVLTDPPVFQLKLTLDDHTELEKSVYAMSLSKGRFAGGGFVIAPEASLDDGQIQVAMLLAMPMLEVVDAGVNFLLTEEDARQRIQTFQARSVKFESQPEIPCSMDGEQTTLTSGEFRVMPRARRVVGGPNALIQATG